MSRATNRTSNISVTWNFKNPNISRNELINFIHLFREVSGYSRGLSRHCLAISAVSRFSTASRSSPGAIFLHFYLSSFIGRPPESLLKGFSLRVSVLQKVSRLLHLKSRDSCCLAISQLPRGPRQATFLHFLLSSLIGRPPESLLKGFPLRVCVLPKVFRKFPEGLFSPIQRTPESFPTTPPEISRFLLHLDISTAPRSSSGAISPLSSFIGRPPESLLKGFSLRVSALPKVSRLRHLKSRDSCCLSILYGPAVFVRRHFSTFIFHRTPARKSPERPSFPSQLPPESFLRGFPLRFSVLPKVSRLRHLKSRDSHLAQK